LPCAHASIAACEYDGGRDIISDDWRPAAIVFDCDGLLVDTEASWTVAETAMFARHGLRFGPEDKATLIGRSIPVAARVMAQRFGRPGESAAIQAEITAMASREIAAHAAAMPGAHRLLELLAGRLPLGVASNATRALLDAALARGQFGDVFRVSIAAEEVAAPKPAPDIYLEACRRLQVEPTRALAFEDSPTGARSARAAGLKVVGIPTLPSADFPADLVVASLDDARLLDWVGRWF
jgi:HAD superfamily hydrolase (TIGR01509 family)